LSYAVDKSNAYAMSLAGLGKAKSLKIARWVFTARKEVTQYGAEG
jgi:hypothetical protein